MRECCVIRLALGRLISFFWCRPDCGLLVEEGSPASELAGVGGCALPSHQNRFELG